MKTQPPKPGHVQKAKILPRDIRLGLCPESKKGTLLAGWCNTTDTYQLWELLDNGDEATARFVGFIKPTC